MGPLSSTTDDIPREAVYVRGHRSSRPQSAKLRPASGLVQQIPTAAGGALAAARSRAAIRRPARPSTAPIHGRNALKKKKKSSPEDGWYEELKRNDLLFGNTSRQAVRASSSYVSKKVEKERNEHALMIAQTNRELEQYERGCVARMTEATRWARTLKLNKSFNPIYSKATKNGKTLLRPPSTQSGRTSIITNSDRGDLMCEVITEPPSHNRVISCELFEREHEKLLHRHQKLVTEQASDLTPSDSDPTRALEEAGVLLGARKSPVSEDGPVAKARQTVLLHERKSFARNLNGAITTTSPGSGISRNSHRPSSANAKPSSVSGSPRNADLREEYDVESELRNVLGDTKELRAVLAAQLALLKDNGWNIAL